MKRTMVVIAIVSLLSVGGHSIAAAMELNIQDGVSDVAWGAGPETIKGLTRSIEKEGILYVRRPEERYFYKGIDLGSVLYGFYENRFFAAYMRIRSDADAKKLMQFFNTDFGSVRRQLRIKETVYIWESQGIKIKLKELLDRNLFKLSFYYTPLSKKLNERRMDENLEITMDLVPSQ